MRALAAVVIVAVVLTACSDDAADDSAAEATVSPTHATTLGTPTSAPPEAQARCPNQTDVVERPPEGPAVTGSIVSNSPDDAAWVATDPDGPPGCRVFLVVELAEGDRLAAPASDEEQDFSLQAQRVHALYDLDGDGYNEILVDLEAGASTQFVGAFKVTRASIERIRLPANVPQGDLFPYGGSVGHIEASDCATLGRRRGIVVSMALPLEDRYEVTRTFYSFRGVTLSEEEQERVVVEVEEVGRLPEYRHSPFGSCPTSVVQQ